MLKGITAVFFCCAAIASLAQDKDGGFQVTPVAGSAIFRTATFQGKRYFICEVDPANYRVELFNNIDPDHRENTFRAIDRTKGKKLVLVVNGGMFMEDLRPLGLYVSGGKVYRNVKRDTSGYGNFYIQPNGIFLIDGDSTPMVTTTRAYLDSQHRALIATQSGPMLVTDSVVNKNFRERSTNLNIRNGVGVNEAGNMVFVTSLSQVNFYEFAILYRDHLKCDNALYLDGVVSQYYAPTINTPDQTLPLGVFIVVSRK